MSRSDELHDWCVYDDVADDPANVYDPSFHPGDGRLDLSDLTDEERVEFYRLRRARRHTGWRGGP